MSDGPDLPPWAKPRPKPPEKRPTWVVVLALAMLLSGGRLLINGGAMLSGGGMDRVAAESAAATQDYQALAESLAKVYRAHPQAVRANGVSKVLIGLLTLFAVAAVFSGDPRARKAAMAVAWGGIAFELGDALFLFTIVRPEMAQMAPVLANLTARQAAGATTPLTPGMAVWLFDMTVVVKGLLGTAFSVLLLT